MSFNNFCMHCTADADPPHQTKKKKPKKNLLQLLPANPQAHTQSRVVKWLPFFNLTLIGHFKITFTSQKTLGSIRYYFRCCMHIN